MRKLEVPRRMKSNLAFRVATLTLCAALLGVTRPTTISDRWPHFAPDGRSLIFMSTREGTAQIYQVQVNGSGLRRVSRPLPAPEVYAGVSWEKNGNLLYSVYRPTAQDRPDSGTIVAEFVTASVDWANPHILYAGINSERPAASPSSDEIVFEQERGPFQSNPPIDIVTFRPSTLSLHLLTRGDGEYIQAAWSPDGSQIAFACAKPEAELQLCVMNADGSNRRVVTHEDGSHQWPAWSPDGKQLVYFLETHSSAGIAAAIGTVAVNGADEHLVTELMTGRRDETPSWSPDGQSIAFQTDRLGHGFRIAIMNANGTNVRILTK